MSSTQPIKPAHPAIKAYHAALETYADHYAEHEGATETAFSRLLADTARSIGWTLIPKQSMTIGKKTIYPDGTLRDVYNLPRGYWEAKDTSDDLNVEIKKKIAKKYPLTNMIFEDTRTAVLYQHGVRVADPFDLTDPQQIADLLNEFYAYAEPNIEGFQQAVEEFKERVPELAAGLQAKIKEAHEKNKEFQAAFDDFFHLCQTALNPNIGRDAVDEMLIQHLLTERLFRKIFQDPEFTRRNVIASEVEKVIAALVRKSFSRDDFLKSLDKFYKAIEASAESITAFEDKQHLLNTVYEQFFQGYSPKDADRYGIVYTPQPIVDFMCASVEEVLKREFGLTLGSPDVTILDPCTGTGNFVVNLLRRVPATELEELYKERLFANEVMLLPYYIAALNIEHAYGDLTGGYEPFEGLCFVDTLDLGGGKVGFRPAPMFTERNAERVERQKKAPITVIIGNPPYNVGQINENDNNKNRKYEIIDPRVRDTYVRDSSATLKNKLYDPYVKFFRWATDRLEGRDGIVCFISNNNFVDQTTFDGMRAHILRDFTAIYHIDLHGNVRLNPKLSGTTHNVFGIQVGVGITLAVRHGTRPLGAFRYYRVPENWRKEQKLSWLSQRGAVVGIEWQTQRAQSDKDWLRRPNQDEFRSFIPIGTKISKSLAGRSAQTVFSLYSPGVNSGRDDVVYGFDRRALAQKVEAFSDRYNAEVDRFRRRKDPEQSVDDFVDYDELKWSEALKNRLSRCAEAAFDSGRIRAGQYRPFTRLFLYFDDVLIDRPGLFDRFFAADEPAENLLICVAGLGNRKAFGCLVSTKPASYDLAFEKVQCFPFYVYDEDGTNRRENITDWALKQLRTHYKSKKISKWDIFHYVYGLLHHPGYRAKFADNLKRDLPRIPFAPDFKAFASAGKKLADLHLNYEASKEYPLKRVVTPGVPLSYVVADKMRLSKDKTELRVNDSLTLTGIPPKVFEYRLGNRSALDWVIDQYRVTEDARSGIVSDPNREDDPQYIVRLVGQVIHVSVETVKIVAGLPSKYSPAASDDEPFRTSLADWAEEHAEDWGDELRSDDVEGFTGRRY